MHVPRKKLLITGFGPFRDWKLNPSWEAVRELEDSLPGWTLVKKEIAVEYHAVQKLVPEWLKEHQPDMVVHVGVGRPDFIQLEKLAHNSGYNQIDVKNKLPQNGECVPHGPTRLTTQLDADCLMLLAQSQGFEARKISTDAGRYLCEFIYFTSLYHTQEFEKYVPVLFIHVPSRGWKSDEILEGLQCIVNELCTHICIQKRGWKSRLMYWYLKLKKGLGLFPRMVLGSKNQ